MLHYFHVVFTLLSAAAIVRIEMASLERLLQLWSLFNY